MEIIELKKLLINCNDLLMINREDILNGDDE